MIPEWNEFIPKNIGHPKNDKNHWLLQGQSGHSYKRSDYPRERVASAKMELSQGKDHKQTNLNETQ